MKNIRFLIVLIFSTISSAQIKGVVKDSITKEPIAYVALVYENTNIGTNSNEKGEFEIQKNENNTNIIVSCLGYKTRVLNQNTINEIYLSRRELLIKEVVVRKRKNTSEIVVGNYKNSIMGFGNGGVSHIWAKYIESTDEIQKHPFIKTIQFTTKSRVKNAKLKLRFFYVDSNKKPGEDYKDEEIIITVKKGTNKNIIDLQLYNISIPKEGLFIGFENLIIEENKYNYNYTKEGEKGKFNGISYEPIIKGYESTSYNVWDIKDGKSFLFNRKIKPTSKPIELGLKLTLTN